MQIIISHAGADFDAFASMVLASKLYPEAKMYFVGSPEPNVREFLTLHRQFFSVAAESDYRDEIIELVVLVDTREPSRLGVFGHIVINPKVQVHIYDHHQPTRESVAGDLERIMPWGAAVTVLLDSIQQKQMKLTPIEATLCLLAIHEETGSLTYPATQAKDAFMLGWLMELGANISLVPHFAQHQLSGEQRALLGELLAHAQAHIVAGLRVIITCAETIKYVDELGNLASRIMDIEHPDALFCLVRMGQRGFVAARSRANTINVGEVLREFGGGGHPTAASASLKGVAIAELTDELLSTIEAKAPGMLTARDIMSTPVECLDIDTSVSIEEASEFLRSLGHSAVCVRQQGKLVGIIARSDVDKAMFHGLGHAPVSAYMIRNIKAVMPDSSLREIQRVLVENDIGRAPVLDSSQQLVGIVSRTDVLRALNQAATVQPMQAPDSTPMELLHLHPDQLAELKTCGELGREIGFEVYAVGGFVRDMLMGIDNTDLDLVVEGDGMVLAEHLATRLRGTFSAHAAFGTAVVSLPNGHKIDIVTARTEVYTRPAALPVVKGSTLKQDLYRRDFSINAMALRLNPEAFGHLVDFFGARRDIKAGLIRVLHNLSFVDDPTRVFRAIRFEQRYGFRCEPNTQYLLVAAVKDDLLSLVSPQRIRDELILVLQERHPVPAILRMDKLKVLHQLAPGLRLHGKDYDTLENIGDLLGMLEGLVQSGTIQPWIVYLNQLVGMLGYEQAQRFVQHYRFRAADIKKLLLDHELVFSTIKVLRNSFARNSEVAGVLRRLSLEACVYLAARFKAPRVVERVRDYLRSWRFAQSPLSGADLRLLGYKADRHMGDMLDWLWAQHVDGLINSADEAVAAVQERWPLP